MDKKYELLPKRIGMRKAMWIESSCCIGCDYLWQSCCNMGMKTCGREGKGKKRSRRGYKQARS